MSPSAIRIAAADLLGKTAGDIVNRVSKAETGRMKPLVFLPEVWIEVIACEVEVRESAWEMICFSLAYPLQ